MTISGHSYKRHRVQVPPPGLVSAAQSGAPIRVHHPLAAHLVLRTSADWHTDLPPVDHVEGAMAEFRLPAGTPAWACKPCLRVGPHLLRADVFPVHLAGRRVL